jgi:hypothetical protein
MIFSPVPVCQQEAQSTLLTHLRPNLRSFCNVTAVGFFTALPDLQHHCWIVLRLPTYFIMRFQ